MKTVKNIVSTIAWVLIAAVCIIGIFAWNVAKNMAMGAVTGCKAAMATCQDLAVKRSAKAEA